MPAHRATAMILGAALAISAQTLPGPEETLAKARDKVLDRIKRLPNYICVQTVNRRYFKREKPELPVPSCDQMSGERTRNTYVLKLEATDRLRLDVKVSGGAEIAAWAGSARFDDGNVMNLVKGPFGTGPFGTFLTDIFTSAGVPFYFAGEEMMEGAELFRYRFQVSRGSSHYMVDAGNEWVHTGYDGDVWIDPGSYQLRRLLVRTSELPAETDTCESTTTVDYAMVRIGTGDFLLPQRSDLHFLMRDTTEDDVAVAYSGCHEFIGEAKLVADPSAIQDHPRPAARRQLPIPPGLVVALKLSQPIDTDTAAAGDVLYAKVSQPVADATSKNVVIPAGSEVRGRIVGIRHWLDSPRRFAISIQVETVEINGAISPIYARLLRGDGLAKAAASNPPGRRNPIFLNQIGQLCPIADHVVYTDGKHYVMPRGYEMTWITVPPPNP